VKTQKNSAHRKIDLLKRPPRDFLNIGNGHPTYENFMFLRFHTASATNGPTEKCSKAAVAHFREHFNGNKMKTTMLVCILSLFGCSDGPSDAEMRAKGQIFRGDMQALIDIGGKVADYQNGTRHPNYYFLTLDAKSFNQELQKKYINKLTAMGWRKINQNDAAATIFCKDGAQALIATSGGTTWNGTNMSSINMVYNVGTIEECKQANRTEN